ncbi:MAG TPA: hypothetical protein VL625_00495 [Patescibacteria group bacterium]|nr:hypothetical protein [Patescibacteria group bacterium]
MQENTLTEKFKDVPEKLTYGQAVGKVFQMLGQQARKRPFLTLAPLALFTFVTGVVAAPVVGAALAPLAAVAPAALVVLKGARNIQKYGTKEGVLNQLLPQQALAVEKASELLTQAEESKTQPGLRNEFMQKAVFYSYFLDKLSQDLNLSAGAKEIQGKIDAEIRAESATGFECLHVVEHMNAKTPGNIVLPIIFATAARKVQKDPTLNFMEQFEETARPAIAEAAFDGHSQEFGIELITEMRDYIRKTGGLHPE